MSADRQTHTHTSINVLQLVSPQGTFQYYRSRRGNTIHSITSARYYYDRGSYFGDWNFVRILIIIRLCDSVVHRTKSPLTANIQYANISPDITSQDCSHWLTIVLRCRSAVSTIIAAIGGGLVAIIVKWVWLDTNSTHSNNCTLLTCFNVRIKIIVVL